MSDIHGCYVEYLKMLDIINFKSSDILYILGDVVDRGPEPMKVLLDMSMRSNVIPIMGNHDWVAWDILRKLLFEFTEDNLVELFQGDLNNFVEYLSEWFKIGGQPTLDTFKKLSVDERKQIIEYLSEFSLYKVVKVEHQTYVLTHSGVPAIGRNKALQKYKLDQYCLMDWLQALNDYDMRYFKDAILVTGHTPTRNIRGAQAGKIYRANGHIAIDTGYVFGDKLSCLCLETGVEFYL